MPILLDPMEMKAIVMLKVNGIEHYGLIEVHSMSTHRDPADTPIFSRSHNHSMFADYTNISLEGRVDRWEVRIEDLWDDPEPEPKEITDGPILLGPVL